MSLTKHGHDKVWQIIRAVVIIASLVLFLFPIYWMLVTAFKTRAQIFVLPPTWIFMPTFANFKQVFLNSPFPWYACSQSFYSAGVVTRSAGGLRTFQIKTGR